MESWEKRKLRLDARLGGKPIPDFYNWLKWLSFESDYQKQMEEKMKSFPDYFEYEKRKNYLNHILELLQKVEKNEANLDERFEVMCFFSETDNKAPNLMDVINSKFSAKELDELNDKLNVFKNLSYDQLNVLLDLANDPDIREEFSMEDEYIIYMLSKRWEEMYSNNKNERIRTRRPKGGVLPRKTNF